MLSLPLVSCSATINHKAEEYFNPWRRTGPSSPHDLRLPRMTPSFPHDNASIFMPILLADVPILLADVNVPKLLVGLSAVDDLENEI